MRRRTLRPRRRPLQTALLFVGITAAGVGIGTAALEVAARAAARLGLYTPKIITEPYLRPNAYLFRTLRPATRIEKGGATIDVNALGFRGSEITPRKPPGTYRIFALGGSTTFGYPAGTPRTEDTWPYQLGRELERRVGPGRVEVVNAGVTGYTSRTSLIDFATRVGWLDPDLVILDHGVNDAITFRDEADLAPAVIATTGVPSPWEQLRDRSLLLLEANYRFYRFFVAPTVAPVRRDEPAPAALAAHERHLRGIVDLARRQGVDVVIASEAAIVPSGCADGKIAGPDRAGLEPIEGAVCFSMDWYFPHLTLAGVRSTFGVFGEIDRRVAADAGLVWVDLNQASPKDAEHYTDFCHHRPAGAAAVARALADAIAPKLAAR